MLPRTSIPLCVLLLSGCVTPKVVHVYDEKCQVMTRRMELTVEKVEALDACSNAECAAQVLGSAISLTTSVIVSGSIALAGNVAFWLEKSANCRPARSAGVAPAAASSAPSASTEKP